MATCLRFLLVLGACVMLSGCPTTRDYNAELGETLAYFNAGQLDGSLAVLERNNPFAPGDLLYHFEKGELLRLKGDMTGSFAAWDYADRSIVAYENSSRFSTFKKLTEYNSYVANDKVRFYDGYDFEKVALTTQMALIFMSNADPADARVLIKKTHEREAGIAEKRDLQYLELENQAQEQGISLQYKDLQGYPVATLDAPEVIALKNSYQSAFSHYLAGFIYEALNEKDLAAPGYRKAVELRPNTPLLEQALRNLDKSPLKAGESDVLLIVQTGLAPARSSVRVPISVDVDGEAFITNMSFPIIVPDTSTPPVDYISVDGKQQKLTLINSFGDMARRTLRDDMPGIIERTLVRAKSNAREQAYLKKRRPELLEATILQQIQREDADTRGWRTLPDKTYIVRLRLKKGVHELTVPNAPEYLPVKFRIDQTHQALSLRAVSNQIYAADRALMIESTPLPQAAVLN
ncbi:COG3014 family protein [Pseudomonas sp. C2B4]|uniref:COG3014 family protein n=1 Tax=Pseudomonas sp. C2B4 TaxID=2735270 RepID=UPI001586C77A|nr:hypothetical protein [Pseudomonas sp. C2B4]NUU33732.1 hypothetical protein [Pseudomonas sp. C2B4]